MELAQKIGMRIKEIRKQKGLTQNDMAKKLGILQPAYARYESGKVQLNYEQIQVLCQLLEITPDVLWGFE